MSASIETGFHQAWDHEPASTAHWDELPTDGTQAWVGLLLMLGSSIITIRGLCWMVAQTIRLLH